MIELDLTRKLLSGKCGNLHWGTSGALNWMDLEKEVVMVIYKKWGGMPRLHFFELLVKCLSRGGLVLIILFGMMFLPLDAVGSGGISGKWKWFNGAEVTFYSNGAVDASNGAKGSWQYTGRVYVIKWTSGWTDTLTLSTDGRQLSGKNNMGSPVSAQRIN